MKIEKWCAVALLLAAAISCGGDDTPAPGGPGIGNHDDDAGKTVCVDEDDDGWGKGCSKGDDCDDTDPDVTDECRRCRGGAVKDCPCKPGTQQVSCEPPVKHVDGGTLVCSEGTRYCRDGNWGDCETIGEYVFVADR